MCDLVHVRVGDGTSPYEEECIIFASSSPLWVIDSWAMQVPPPPPHPDVPVYAFAASIVAIFISLLALRFSHRQWQLSSRKDRAWIVPSGARNDNSMEYYYARIGEKCPPNLPQYIKPHIAANLPVRPIVELTNGGTTPALQFATKYHWKIYQSDKFPDSPDYTDCKVTHPGAFSVGNVVERHYDDISLTPEQREDIASRKLFLIVYGTAVYVDVLQNKHITTWCYVYVPEHDHFERYHAYNDAT